MAISHARPMLLLLLSISFFLGLCGAVKFENCRDREYPIQVSKLEVSPDPVLSKDNVTLIITASSTTPYPKDMLRVVSFAGYYPLNQYNLCDTTACPGVTSVPFVFTLRNIIPSNFPDVKAGFVDVSIYLMMTASFRFMCVTFRLDLPNSHRGF